ncbi:hypothetical protein J3R82DRAFT_3275, partial [Butyriboletus roseoflavus]
SDYLTMADMTGIHFMTVNYCTCSGSDIEYLQLLHCKLYLATLQILRTTFTFTLLDNF